MDVNCYHNCSAILGLGSGCRCRAAGKLGHRQLDSAQKPAWSFSIENRVTGTIASLSLAALVGNCPVGMHFIRLGRTGRNRFATSDARPTAGFRWSSASLPQQTAATTVPVPPAPGDRSVGRRLDDHDPGDRADDGGPRLRDLARHERSHVTRNGTGRGSTIARVCSEAGTAGRWGAGCGGETFEAVGMAITVSPVYRSDVCSRVTVNALAYELG